MDSMEVNKGIAAVLIAGIAFFLTGLIGMQLVPSHAPHTPAMTIPGAPDSHEAAGPAKQEALAPIAPLLAKADPAAGEATAKKLCMSCHTFAEGGKAGVGPNIYGSVGANRGNMAGYNYSNGFKAKLGTWTYEDLNAWLAKPGAFAPGTRMAFAGINKAETRADVIAFLRTLSKNPVPLP